MKIQNIKKSNSYKLTVSVAVLALVTVISYSAYAYLTNKWPFDAATSNETSSSEEHGSDSAESRTVNHDTPDSQFAKKNLLSDSDESLDNQSNSRSKRAGASKVEVPVGLAHADIYNNSLEIRAFTNGAIESGRCKAIVTHNDTGHEIIEAVNAFIDVSTTQCEPIFIGLDKLSPGQWSVAVEFTSSTKHGVSETREVIVP